MLASNIEEFSILWPSEKPSKFHRFSHRFFYRFWLRSDLQLGAILEPKTPQNPQKWLPKTRALLPKSGSEYDLPCEHRFGSFWHRFGEGQGSILKIFASFFELPAAYFGHVFGCSCSQSSWLGFRRSSPSPHPRESKNLPRTRPRNDPYRRLQKTADLKA